VQLKYLGLVTNDLRISKKMFYCSIVLLFLFTNLFHQFSEIDHLSRHGLKNVEN
jgi:hypothetical protein